LRKRSGDDDRDCSARGTVPAEVVELMPTDGMTAHWLTSTWS
jgi:hypothetical protein